MVLQTASHARSISAPSFPHPIAIKAAEELRNLKTCIHGTGASFSTLCSLLQGLADLFESLHLLLRLPSFQQVLSQPSHKSWIEAQLDCSLQLLDIEAPLNDYLASVKSFVLDLQSAIRRRGDNGHVNSRKKAQKEALSCSKSLKKLEEGFVIAALVKKEGDLVMLDRLTRESWETTVAVLQFLLTLLEMPVRRKAWSKRILLVPKAMQWKRGGSGEGNGEASKAVGLESLLNAAVERISGKDDVFGNLQRKADEELNQVKSGIEGLEIGLQRLFRRMIQNRVVLLNMLSF
ncbi:uncharacterized protein LOC110019729 [Phalaenopsis equestris]|uniref:uncharacterized protein LOC110019729 n=1 Tax=Phalaenopsis equestris TaxID=78828 RepID=UPI0009E583CC|nr:uncharacterized protein LOC110019729 [Phalaenopsis equestris]